MRLLFGKQESEFFNGRKILGEKIVDILWWGIQKSCLKISEWERKRKNDQMLCLLLKFKERDWKSTKK